MGQEALRGGCGHVGEMGVGWGLWSWIIVRVDRAQLKIGPTFQRLPILHNNFKSRKATTQN